MESKLNLICLEIFSAIFPLQVFSCQIIRTYFQQRPAEQCHGWRVPRNSDKPTWLPCLSRRQRESSPAFAAKLLDTWTPVVGRSKFGDQCEKEVTTANTRYAYWRNMWMAGKGGGGGECRVQSVTDCASSEVIHIGYFV